MAKDKQREYDQRRADPILQDFIDAMREIIDKEPLYNRLQPRDVDRFYVFPSELPTTPLRTRNY